MRYVLDFGSANAGGAPTFSLFVRLDTLAAMAQPAIVEIGGGQYYFDLDWSTTTATSITFKATIAGIELSDTISSPDVLLPGATTASAGASSTDGYSAIGPLIARAGTQCGVLNLNPVDQASYDPFSSSDPSIVQLLEFANVVGADLTSKVNDQLRREVTFVTAGGATSYAMPSDFVAMVDQTGWDRTSVQEMFGPVSSAYANYLKAWNSGSLISIPFRIQGNRLTFPVAPADGLTCAFEYISSYWVQTAASGTGPDANHVTASSDFVLYDPNLFVMGLVYRFLTAKGRDTTAAWATYKDRLDFVMGKNVGGSVLSLSGGSTTGRFMDEGNYPARLG